VWGGWESPSGSKNQVCVTCHCFSWWATPTSTVKDDCTAYQRRPRCTKNSTLIICYQNCCRLQDSSARMVHLHTARVAQDWIATNCTGFIGKYEWPPNFPDLNQLDYYVWGDNARVLRHVSAEAKKHRWAEGCPAGNLEWVATELNQQDGAEFHQESTTMC